MMTHYLFTQNNISNSFLSSVIYNYKLSDPEKHHRPMPQKYHEILRQLVVQGAKSCPSCEVSGCLMSGYPLGWPDLVLVFLWGVQIGSINQQEKTVVFYFGGMNNFVSMMLFLSEWKFNFKYMSETGVSHTWNMWSCFIKTKCIAFLERKYAPWLHRCKIIHTKKP